MIARELFYPLPDVDLSDTKLALQNMMSAYVGIVRCEEGLLHALHELNVMADKAECNHNVFYYSPLWSEVRNMITCAKLIVEQSLSRTENKGVFFNRDLHVSLPRFFLYSYRKQFVSSKFYFLINFTTRLKPLLLTT